MIEFSKHMFKLSIVISLLSIATMSVYASLYSKLYEEYKPDKNHAEVLGVTSEGYIIPDDGSFFSLKIVGTNDSPQEDPDTGEVYMVTGADMVSFEGEKEVPDFVYMQRGHDDQYEPEFNSVDTHAGQTWESMINTLLNDGRNNFKFISAPPRDVTNAPSTIYAQDMDQYFFMEESKEIVFRIEKVNEPFTAQMNYNPVEPVPRSGILEIKAKFSESLDSTSIPIIAIYMRSEPDHIVFSPREMQSDDPDGKIWKIRYDMTNLPTDVPDYKFTAIVKITEAIDIYGRELSDIVNDDFEIAAKTSDSEHNQSSNKGSTSQDSQTDSTTQSSSYEDDSTVEKLSEENDKDFQEDFEESDSNIVSSDSQSNSDDTVSKLLSARLANPHKIFIPGATIYINVIYRKNPKSKIINNRYSIRGFKYNPDILPLFADFSAVDSNFETRRQLIGQEIQIKENIYVRRISYKISLGNSFTNKSDLLIPIVFSDGLSTKQIQRNIRISLRESDVEIYKMMIAKKDSDGTIKYDKYDPRTTEIIKYINGENEDIRFEGKAKPNTVIHLYVYSDPLIITIKTDDEGKWSYTLKENLDVGTHTVYATLQQDEDSGIPKDLAQIADFRVYANSQEAKADVFEEIDPSSYVDYTVGTVKPTSGLSSNQKRLPLVITGAGILLIILSLSFIFVYIKKERTKPNTNKQQASL